LFKSMSRTLFSVGVTAMNNAVASASKIAS